MKLSLLRTATKILSLTMSTDTHSETTAEVVYTPPQVWKYESSEGSKFTMNRPTAGERFERELPKGDHPIQLYSLATPNGQKVTIMLEELIEIGKDAEYDAWPINIMKEDQFGNEFVSINPNSKIPAMKITDGTTDEPLNLFESGSIILHLAEKYDAFIPKDINKRAQTLNWLFWQMGSGPYLGGGFGHFFAYADVKIKYAIDRFTMESKRQLDVLDKHLANNKYMVGDEYTIADIAIFPWYGGLVLGRLYPNSKTFLNVDEEYPNVIRWATEIDARPAVKRGKVVNKVFGDVQLAERHSPKDFDNIVLE
jgi:GSH-dependent disulfide-bond oxidoreductase